MMLPVYNRLYIHFIWNPSLKREATLEAYRVTKDRGPERSRGFPEATSCQQWS